MAQFHVDYYGYGEVTPWAEGTMAYAQSKGVPIWSADEWLRFTEARARAAVDAPSWDGSQLAFTLTVPSGPDTLPLMVPIVSSGGRLAGLTIDGSSTPYQTRTVNGAGSAVVSVSPGSHAVVAMYAAVAPSVTTVTPTKGPTAGGTAVTVSGTAFDPLATVTFGGVGATDVRVGANGTSITAVTPAHAAGAVDVAVTNPGDRTASVHGAFTYIPPPTIAAVSPQSGSTAGGGEATLIGTGFQAGASVTFGGTGATGIAVSADGTRVRVVAPAHGAGSVDIAVTNPDGQRATMPSAYTYGTVSVLPKPEPTAPGGGGPAGVLPPSRPASGAAGGGAPNPMPAKR